MRIFRRSNSAVLRDPNPSAGTVLPTSPDATGVYTYADFTYASTIDLALTTLKGRYCVDNGVAAANPAAVPILIPLHGYSGDSFSFTLADIQQWASYGFAVCVPDLRGRNGSDGTADANGREGYDIVDMLAHVRATYAATVDPDRAADVGFSGGGGLALGLATRCPDLTVACIVLFGISDYGYNGSSDASWYAFYGPAPALLDADIGVRTDGSDPYFARYAINALPTTLKYGPFVELFHDDDDAIVSVESSRVLVDAFEAAGIGANKFLYHESDSAQWPHGHPNDNRVAMTNAEKLYIPRCSAAAWSMPQAGEITVNGWFYSKPLGLEIWLGSAANPKTNGGDTDRVARVAYNTITGVYEVTPLTTTGNFFVWIKQGSDIATAQLTTTTTSIISLYGSTAAGPRVLMDASLFGLANDAVVASATDYSGNGHHFVMTGSPQYKTTALASGPSIRFTGTQYGVCPDPILDGATEYSVAVVAAFTTITGQRVAAMFGQNSAPQSGFGLGCNLASTSKFEIEQPAQTFDAGSAADTSPHLFVMQYSPSASPKWSLYIDDMTTPVVLSDPNTAPVAPAVRAVIGAYSSAGAFPFIGDLGYLEAVTAAWTEAERTARSVYVKTKWTTLP